MVEAPIPPLAPVLSSAPSAEVPSPPPALKKPEKRKLKREKFLESNILYSRFPKKSGSDLFLILELNAVQAQRKKTQRANIQEENKRKPSSQPLNSVSALLEGLSLLILFSGIKSLLFRVGKCWKLISVNKIKASDGPTN